MNKLCIAVAFIIVAFPVFAQQVGGPPISISGGGPAGTASSVVATPQGRLTLTSGTPVMTSDVIAATTVYYDSYVGNQVPVGATLANLAITSNEISMGLAVANVVSGNVYDVFAVNSGGLAICIGPAWSTTTARGTGAGTTQLNRTNGGIWTNAVSLTHCWGGAAGTTDLGSVAANAGTYLGSLYATASGQTAMSFKPAAASGGTNNFLALYNAYNRQLLGSVCRDSAADYTSTNTSWERANTSSSNRITWLDGLGESTVEALSQKQVANSGSAGGTAIGIDFNSTSATPDTSEMAVGNTNGTLVKVWLSVRANFIGLGLNFAQGMQIVGSGTGTFYNPGIGAAGGLVVKLQM